MLDTDQANAESNFQYILGDASNYVPFSGLESVPDAQSLSMAGRPSGRYKQWRAILTPGGLLISSPTLSEVRVYYHGG